jgi:hypothetical protein
VAVGVTYGLRSVCGRSAHSSASCGDAYKAAVAAGGVGYGRQAVDNADATAVHRHGRAVSAGKRIDENLT